MSLLPSSVQPFVGTPLDDLRPLAYALWQTDFLSQAISRDLAEFYSTKDFVPQGNRIDALNISKMYLELDQVEHSELYVIDPTLLETDRDARLAEIKAHTTTIQREVIELWEVVTNYVSTARAAGTPVVVDDVWASFRRILTNRLQRASTLGDHGSAATIQSRSQFSAVTHAVVVPAPPPTAISQPDGSYHVLNVFTIPAYAHRDCVKIPGKSCFYCGVANHTLLVCPTLKSDYVRNTMRAGFDRTVFDKHGSASAKKRKRDVDYSPRPTHRHRDDRDDRGVVMIVTMVVVITVATVDMDVMTVALGVALVVETTAVIVLAVTTAGLVVMTVTPATLLMMQSTVTLDAVVLRLLRTTPSYHPPSTVSSKSLNRLACYPKFLLQYGLCPTYLHRRRALHYIRLLRLLRLCHWRQLSSNRPHCQPTTGLQLTPVISTSLKSRLTRSLLPTVYTSTHHARYSNSLRNRPKWIFHCSHPVPSWLPAATLLPLHRKHPSRWFSNFHHAVSTVFVPIHRSKSSMEMAFLPYTRISATVRMMLVTHLYLNR
ncbi:hypothetical protein DYB26_016353 [Aphanomyces astaci]|uniref:Uncharacterized protein n=1 Tax=Aphanomyces astaci TaxID=112090 RepID=A0A3R7FKT5_APHAT|nr:hypothetical protein DYB26_016353 [Aphanomyces astaci]